MWCNKVLKFTHFKLSDFKVLQDNWKSFKIQFKVIKTNLELLENKFKMIEILENDLKSLESN